MGMGGSNPHTQKLLWFEITKMLIAVFKTKLIVLFTTIFGTLSFLIVGQCITGCSHIRSALLRYALMRER